MCDAIAIVQADRVWFAKNSDREANEAQLLEWHAAAEHRAGDPLRCTWIEIAQARTTNAVLLSRPFWIWGAETAANDRGLIIGNEAVFTTLPVQKVGLTGMDLVRLGAERADNARQAIEVITGLLEVHGQGGSCSLEQPNFRYHNSFLIADPHEAFVLETADREWALERVEGVRTISNDLSIPSFAESYRDNLVDRVASAACRRQRTHALATGIDSTSQMFEILRDHGKAGSDAQPHFSPFSGNLTAPCQHAGGWLGGSVTTASWVAELSPGRVQHWVTGTSAPCLSLFKPVSVEQPLDLPMDATAVADDTSLWWRNERLHRLVMRDPERLRQLFIPERNRIEQEWLVSPPDPLEAFAVGDRLLDNWLGAIRAASTGDRRSFFLKRFWEKQNRNARLAL